MSQQNNIHYVTPYSIDKNFGRAYNEACELAPAGSWICLRDGDTMFLNPAWGMIINAAVADHGEDYRLIGCYMNRLADTHQLHQLRFNESPDITEHLRIAKNRFDAYGTEVVPISSTQIIAGAFMLFPKWVWEKTPFREKCVDADVWFNRDIRHNHAGSIGIMPGLYIFHLYRMWATNDPRHEVKHLK